MTNQLAMDLKALKQEVMGGRCRIGDRNSAGLPCLMGAILALASEESRRRDMVAAIAAHLPPSSLRFERPQSRIMRFVRQPEMNARLVVKVIDKAIASNGGGSPINKLIRWASAA